MRMTTLLFLIFALAFGLPFAGVILSKKGGKDLVKTFSRVSVSFVFGGVAIWTVAMLTL